jgi:hypothetical protein
MKTRKDTHNFSQHNLSITDREVRVLVGAGMIAAVMINASSPIGAMPYLALVAIPFIITALIGWDPLYSLVGLNTDKQRDDEIQQRNWAYNNIGMFDRAIRFALGSALIAFTLSGAVAGWEAVASLAAVPLIATAIFAWDPFYALTNNNTFASRYDVEMANTELGEDTVAKLYDFPTQAASSNSDLHGKAA